MDDSMLDNPFDRIEFCSREEVTRYWLMFMNAKDQSKMYIKGCPYSKNEVRSEFLRWERIDDALDM